MKELNERQQKVKNAIAYLKNFFDTYDKQAGYLGYTDETIIEDTLYGLGVALDEDEYRYATGFSRFKTVLKKHIKNHP